MSREAELLLAVRTAAHLLAVGLDAQPDIDGGLRDVILRQAPDDAPLAPMTWARSALTRDDWWRLACWARLGSAEEATSGGALIPLRRACLLAERVPPAEDPLAAVLVLPSADLDVVVCALGSAAARRVARSLGESGPAWLRVALATLGAELADDGSDELSPRLLSLFAMLPEVAPFLSDVVPESLGALVVQAEQDDAALLRTVLENAPLPD